MTTFTRTSPLTRTANSMDIPITLAEWEAHIDSGKLIQKSFPQLTPEQREFLMTGYTPEDWLVIFGPEGEDEE